LINSPILHKSAISPAPLKDIFLPVHLIINRKNIKIMAITQEAAVASIIPSPLAKSKLANGDASSGIFADPSIGDECFPGEPTLTVGNVLNKLANKCAAFQRRLAQGERVQGVSFFYKFFWP
jgi:hypothetical protein